MLTLIVWWTTILLEAVILIRISKNGVLRAHPIFAFYLACVLASSVSGYIVFETSRHLYRYWYWGWEFVCVLAGYCVILEILEKAMEFCEGPKRFVRNAGLVVLASIVGFTTLQLTLGRELSVSTSVEIERNLRTAEAVLLAVIIAVVSYYRVPMGRNLKGILLGYGLGVVTIIMSNTVRSYVGHPFQVIFSSVRSYSYSVSLVIWMSALWSYDPNPVPQAPTQLPADYESLVRTIKNTLSGMRGNLRKTALS